LSLKILDYADRGTLLTPAHIRPIAERIANSDLGVNWVSTFLKRHSDELASRHINYQEEKRRKADVYETRKADVYETRKADVYETRKAFYDIVGILRYIVEAENISTDAYRLLQSTPRAYILHHVYTTWMNAPSVYRSNAETARGLCQGSAQRPASARAGHAYHSRGYHRNILCPGSSFGHLR
jgi:hypothetical protein